MGILGEKDPVMGEQWRMFTLHETLQVLPALGTTSRSVSQTAHGLTTHTHQNLLYK